MNDLRRRLLDRAFDDLDLAALERVIEWQNRLHTMRRQLDLELKTALLKGYGLKFASTNATREMKARWAEEPAPTPAEVRRLKRRIATARTAGSRKGRTGFGSLSATQEATEEARPWQR
jgi:hypothetical protein